MRIAVYGGSFNPPHLGHIKAAMSASQKLSPDIFLIIPDNIPPHKDLYENSPDPSQRLEMCRIAFSDIPGAQISDMELKREGRSYTAETVGQLKRQYPDDELMLIIGTDMLLTFNQWYRFRYLLENCTLAALARADGDLEKIRRQTEVMRREYGAKIEIVPHEPLEMSSSLVRERLQSRMGANLLSDRVYSLIIKNNWYGALPELMWLREKAYALLKPERIAHVAGCESEAVMLAKRFGEDPEKAATAGILHDITKRFDTAEQLLLCEKYGIIVSNPELAAPKTLHARTGAAMARDVFGVSEEIYEAIRWHTTGKPDMTLLEKIIYLADFIEPTREFSGVDKLRELAYDDIDKAMALGLSMSLDEVRARGSEPLTDTAEAFKWYSQK